MHRQALLTAILAVGSCAAAEPARPLQDPEPPPPLREGRWMTRNPRSPIGHGVDTRISLENSGRGWTITLTTIDYPGVGRGNPTESPEGPFAVSAKDQVLEYDTPRGRVRCTFRFDGQVLVCPAVVQKDDQTWRMETTEVLSGGTGKSPEFTVQKEYVWHCGLDPRITSRGPATFPAIRQPNPAPKSYTYEVEQDDRGRSTTVLRFLEEHSGKGPKESCRLFWDPKGTLRFQGDSWYRCEQKFYFPSP